MKKINDTKFQVLVPYIDAHKKIHRFIENVDYVHCEDYAGYLFSSSSIELLNNRYGKRINDFLRVVFLKIGLGSAQLSIINLVLSLLILGLLIIK